MKKGLTLIEVLVSLGISSIVFLMVSSLLVTFYTTDTRSKQVELFERTKNDVVLLISNSVRWATEVGVDGGVLRVDDDTFYLDQGRLYKNDEPITSEGVRVVRFEIQDYSGFPGFPSVEIKISVQDAENALRTDEVRLVVSMRKSSAQADL